MRFMPAPRATDVPCDAVRHVLGLARKSRMCAPLHVEDVLLSRRNHTWCSALPNHSRASEARFFRRSVLSCGMPAMRSLLFPLLLAVVALLFLAPQEAEAVEAP